MRLAFYNSIKISHIFMHCFLGYYQVAQLRKITVNIIMFVGFKIGRAFLFRKSMKEIKKIRKSAIMTIPGGNIITSINFFMKNIDIDLSY